MEKLQGIYKNKMLVRIQLPGEAKNIGREIFFGTGFASNQLHFDSITVRVLAAKQYSLEPLDHYSGSRQEHFPYS